MRTSLVLIILATVFVVEARCEQIHLDTTGTDNFLDADFYGIAHEFGAQSVDEIVFDISDVSGAFFDLDGNGNFGGANLPVVDSVDGPVLQISDISFTWPNMGMPNDDMRPNQLTVQFADQAFTAGSSIRFAVDTDFLGDDPETGGEVFGELGIEYSILFADGTQQVGRFQVDPNSPNTSVGVVVPEPGIAALLAHGVLTSLLFRRRKTIPTSCLC